MLRDREWDAIVRAGADAGAVAALLCLPLEAVEGHMAAAEERRRVRREPLAPPRPRLMTPLLARPDLERWQMRRVGVSGNPMNG